MDFGTARRAMVDGQVRTSDVIHFGIIAAMLDIPREVFVPKAQAAFAYLDRDVAISATGTRYLIKPMVLARLLQAADPGPASRVLVIGAGTGYSAAVLSRLAGEVIALEEDPALCAQARAALARADAAINAGRISIVEGPLAGGSPERGPYDVVLVDGGVETVPDTLCPQLSSQGRLLAVEVKGPVGRAKLFQPVNGRWSSRELFDAVAPVLPGFRVAPTFVF